MFRYTYTYTQWSDGDRYIHLLTHLHCGGRDESTENVRLHLAYNEPGFPLEPPATNSKKTT